MDKQKQKKSVSSMSSSDVSFKVSIPYILLKDFDEELTRHGYSTRSEAVREAIRSQLETWTGRRY